MANQQTSKLLVKLSRRLYIDESERDRFIAALTHPRPFHPCILWCREPDRYPFLPEPPLPWQPSFVDRLAIGTRPGTHPLHHQGYFYCLDFSSVFAATVLLTIPQPVQQVLDLCAAPGGKSVFAWRSLHPSLLLCNEVIGKRIGALVSNLQRCHIHPHQVFSYDSEQWAMRSPMSIDVVLVDAPCTGQSLIAKGDDAPGCFHPVQINKNANRQRRILANAAQTVALGGYLAYMTCTYSPEENEETIAWLLTRFPQFQPIVVPALQPFQSHLTTLPCYRMMPQDGLGAGAFTCLLQHLPVTA